MRSVGIFFFFLVCALSFFSCHTVAKRNVLYVNLTDRSKFVLLPLSGIEKDMDMAQALSAEIRGQNYFFNAWVKANENEIEMSFFNELGAGIGELSFRDGIIYFSSIVIPKAVLRSIKSEYAIADFQLCFYDPVLLGESLKSGGLVLEINDGNRRVLNGNDVIIDIKKTVNTVEFVNHLRGYTYTLAGDFSVMR